ncbi:hypothetical protein [Frateuria sp. Soil773]|uniref:hypothetical protein n=1 Tax=Frateuria sp. Soil773 TaxID=1736407 RepID=UPI0012F7740E|nr:hypothetical protein [Frateuria sp. Soil773]
MHRVIDLRIVCGLANNGERNHSEIAMSHYPVNAFMPFALRNKRDAGMFLRGERLALANGLPIID